MLRTRFDVLALEELLARAGEGSLARDAVAITLDDGYRDALEVAVPLLAAAAVPVTLFVSTQADRGPYWWDVLEAVLLGGEELPGSLRIRLPQEVLELPTHDAAARRHAHDRLHGCLVPAPLAVRTHAMDQLVHQAGPAPAGPERLDPDQVAALARRPGVAIGSHGVHHLALTHVEEDAAWRELAESRRTLERLLGAPPAAICYAYGVAGRDAADLAAAAGYAWGLTRGPGMLERGVDRLLTPRVVTAGEAAAGLEARLVRVLDGCRSTDASR
jgi:peptidoglycan/xylan/chitin deacetylase (PgdA/CDA1 family)